MGRNLLNRSHEVLGLDQKFWSILETGGYGEDATGGLIPLAAGAFEHIGGQIVFNIPREDSAARSGRSVVTRLSGKKEVELSMEGYIIPGTPSGANPTLPPIHPFLLCVFGSVDTSNPAEIKYQLSRLNSNSFRLIEEATHYAKLATGCVIDSVTFSLPGDGKAQFSAEGFAQDVFFAGEAKLDVLTNSANTLELEAGEGGKFEVGALVDVIDGTDGDTIIVSARKITAIAGDILPVDGAAFSAAVGDIVIGHAPDTYNPITSENALLGLKGTCTIAGLGASDTEVIMAEISITNNFTKKDFLYGTSKTKGYLPDKRRAVALKLELLLNKNNFKFFMRNKKFTAENVTLTLEPQDIPAPVFTTSAGRTFEFTLPRVEFNIPDLEQPADGYVTLALEGVALGTDINTTDTELTLTIK